jgi:hypothetical protein
MPPDIRNTDDPRLITPSELISALPSAFEQGLANGDLLFFESTTSKHSENGIQVSPTTQNQLGYVIRLAIPWILCAASLNLEDVLLCYTNRRSPRLISLLVRRINLKTPLLHHIRKVCVWAE